MPKNWSSSFTVIRSLTPGVVGGAAHASLAIALWSVFGFENLLTAASTETLYVAYVLTGMFILGFLPTILLFKYQSRVPAILVTLLFALCAVGTWRTVQSGVTPVGPTPFGWYILFWVAVGVVVTLSGWIELRIRRRKNNYA